MSSSTPRTPSHATLVNRAFSRANTTLERIEEVAAMQRKTTAKYALKSASLKKELEACCVEYETIAKHRLPFDPREAKGDPGAEKTG